MNPQPCTLRAVSQVKPLLYGSVCSGIEAVSLAWQPFGLEAAWFAEIEPFPSAVLAHHYPHVPNLGNMTEIVQLVRAGTVPAPDILVGGTPCQSFSVAGARRGLNDPRGALTLAYVELANAIDQTRRQGCLPSATLVWENVPGVLNDRSNAFGYFLGALAGESRALQPPGEKWAHAGCVSGPRRRIAWRVLDAQYFGVAQRRKRVFLVASGGDDLDPAEVLFERAGLLGDSRAGCSPWQETPLAAGRGLVPAGEYAGLNPHYSSITTTAGFGGGNTAGPIDVAACLTAAPGPKSDFGVETFLVQSIAGAITHMFSTANGDKGSSENGTGKGVPTIAFAAQGCGSDATMARAPTPRACGMPAIAFAENSHGELRFESGHGQLVGALSTGGGKPGQGQPMVLSQAPRQRVGVVPAIAFAQNNRGEVRFESGHGQVACTVLSSGKPGYGVPMVACVALRGRQHGLAAELGGGVAAALRASSGGADKPHVLAPDPEAHFRYDWDALAAADWLWRQWRVRRLMPVECERLQGMPDNYTLIPYRGKPAADAPRYKAIGNSMAVPCVAWLGQRLVRCLQKTGLSASD